MICCQEPDSPHLLMCTHKLDCGHSVCLRCSLKSIVDLELVVCSHCFSFFKLDKQIRYNSAYKDLLNGVYDSTDDEISDNESIYSQSDDDDDSVKVETKSNEKDADDYDYEPAKKKRHLIKTESDIDDDGSDASSSSDTENKSIDQNMIDSDDDESSNDSVSMRSKEEDDDDDEEVDSFKNKDSPLDIFKSVSSLVVSKSIGETSLKVLNKGLAVLKAKQGKTIRQRVLVY